MKILFLFLLAIQLLISCNSSSRQSQTDETSISQSVNKEDSIVYSTENLIIKKLSDHCYQHISYLNTNDFGRVDCNGMIIVRDHEAIIFDTPADSIGTTEIIQAVSETLKATITALIPTHFHGDCAAGLEIFYTKKIPTYASNKTIELLKPDKDISGLKGFEDTLVLNIGNKQALIEYFGKGHTVDNVIGYYPEDNAMFGGCLIKANGASKGYLGDANVEAWPETVRKIKEQFPEASVIIPGHGNPGGTELLDYTIHLFE